MRIIFILLFNLFFISCLHANEISSSDIKEMTPEEINELPEEVLNKLDAKEIMKKFDIKENEFNTLISFALYRLLYFFEKYENEILEEKIKQFQKKINEEQTGRLTMGQWEKLATLTNNFNETEIMPLAGFGEELNLIRPISNFFQTEGTFYLIDDKIAYPVNKTQITCRKNYNNCEVIMAFVMLPYENDINNVFYLDLQIDNYEIIKWDNEDIIAETSSECRSTQLNINFNSNEVFEITRNNKTDECKNTMLNQLLESQGEESMPDLDKPRIAKLVPSNDLINKFWKERKKRSQDVLPDLNF